MSQPRPSGAIGPGRRMARHPPARPLRLSLDDFARCAGLHPELIRRLVALGLVRATRDGSGELWFAYAELATVARIQRLRAGLNLNYAAVGVVLDLLDRIDTLERALRVRPPKSQRDGDRPWT